MSGGPGEPSRLNQPLLPTAWSRPKNGGALVPWVEEPLEPDCNSGPALGVRDQAGKNTGMWARGKAA